jgi:hypothetical protein
LPAARKYGHITKAVANFFISDWFKEGWTKNDVDSIKVHHIC